MVQWLRICLPMQETWVRSLGKIPCATEKIPRAARQLSLRITTTKPALWSPRATATESICPEPVLHHKRSHRSKKPEHRYLRVALPAVTTESPRTAKNK